MDRVGLSEEARVTGTAGQRYRERLHLREDPVEVLWKDDVDQYLTAMGELFDVGIAPLRHDQFNVAKSWLKPMEYAARGVFAIRADTPDYERLGIGIRAKRPRDRPSFRRAGHRAPAGGSARSPPRPREGPWSSSGPPRR